MQIISTIFSHDLSLPVILFRLSAGFIAGGIIGAEREGHTTPAGLRTHILICTGASLLMLLSIFIAGETNDPGRIAAQVVSGIGFLGAGAILRFGATVQGLTSAASIWATAALGLAVGAGFLIPAAFFTMLLYIALRILDHFEKRFMRHSELKAVNIWLKGKQFDTAVFRDIITEFQGEIKNLEIAYSKEKMETIIKYIVKFPHSSDLQRLAARLGETKKVLKFRLNQEF